MALSAPWEQAFDLKCIVGLMEKTFRVDVSYMYRPDA